MNTEISNYYKPAFTGMQIDWRIPSKVRQAIKQNPAVQYGARKLDLNFEFVPLAPKSKNGFVFCIVSPIKKSFFDYLNPFKRIFSGYEIHMGITKPKNTGIFRFLKDISEQKDFFEKEYLISAKDAKRTFGDALLEVAKARINGF